MDYTFFIESIENNMVTNNFDELLEYIKDNNLKNRLSFKSYPMSIVLAVHSNIVEYNIVPNNLMVITYDLNAKLKGHIKIIPKKVLDIFTVDQIVELLELCEGDYAIDPEFKTTKKYMQAELKYRL